MFYDYFEIKVAIAGSKRDSISLFKCRICGGIVIDKVQHDKFHDEIFYARQVELRQNNASSDEREYDEFH